MPRPQDQVNRQEADNVPPRPQDQEMHRQEQGDGRRVEVDGDAEHVCTDLLDIETLIYLIFNLLEIVGPYLASYSVSHFTHLGAGHR